MIRPTYSRLPWQRSPRRRSFRLIGRILNGLCLSARIIPPNLLTTTLFVAEAIPFSQSDWAIPALRPQIRIDDPPNLLTTTLAVVEPLPFAQFDWPNPRPITILQTDIPPNLQTLVFAPVPAPPFAQYDWPNPINRIVIMPDSSTSSSMALLTAPPVEILHRQYFVHIVHRKRGHKA